MKAEDLVRQIEEKLGSLAVRPEVANMGRVVSVADGIVRADGLSRAGYGELVEFEDGRRVTGQNWMQKMLAIMSRPGIKHRKLSKMNFLGMGPWMMGVLAKQYGVASPAELLEAAQAMGVEFVPCQMTMDMFGLTRDDLIEGMGEPVGAATYLSYVADGASPIFI